MNIMKLIQELGGSEDTDPRLEAIEEMMTGGEGSEDPQEVSARSKAQFRMLQGIARGTIYNKSISPERAKEMLAPPIDESTGFPIRQYYQYLPETAEEGPDPYRDPLRPPPRSPNRAPRPERDPEKSRRKRDRPDEDEEE